MLLSSIKTSEPNAIEKWFKTVDVFNLVLLLCLASFGMLVVISASPSIAIEKKLDGYYFVEHHLYYLIVSLCCLFVFSTLSRKGILRISILGFIVTTVLLFLVLIFSNKINGSTRWITISSFSIQPSEFVKPFFIIITAYLFTNKNEKYFNLSGNNISLILLSLLCFLLMLQTDVAMFTIIFMVWCCQYFISGIKIKIIGLISLLGMIFSVLIYYTVPYVKLRIDSYLSPNTPGFQVKKGLLAFESGGIIGKGPGEGTVKGNIPDAHTDFIFPVIAEEYGLIACLSLIALFVLIIMRGFSKTKKIKNMFVLIASTGLLVQFGLQALINIAVSLQLAPTTGVTLPFISYGGSSIVSIGIGMGMMLALTRRTYGGEAKI